MPSVRAGWVASLTSGGPKAAVSGASASRRAKYVNVVRSPAPAVA